MNEEHRRDTDLRRPQSIFLYKRRASVLRLIDRGIQGIHIDHIHMFVMERCNPPRYNRLTLGPFGDDAWVGAGNVKTVRNTV